jgi:hypothetical protein
MVLKRNYSYQPFAHILLTRRLRYPTVQDLAPKCNRHVIRSLASGTHNLQEWKTKPSEAEYQYLLHYLTQTDLLPSHCSETWGSFSSVAKCSRCSSQGDFEGGPTFTLFWLTFLD